jgi:NADH-quinone oxidoreductase subunit E
VKVSDQLEQMTPELKAFILEWKSKPGNLIMVLHQVQQKYGYIPRNIAIETAELLEVPLAKIYGVVTFYNFFKLQKAGKYIIQVCLGTACYLRGGDDIIKEFRRFDGDVARNVSVFLLHLMQHHNEVARLGLPFKNERLQLRRHLF